jgi:hypothetical protein
MYTVFEQVSEWMDNDRSQVSYFWYESKRESGIIYVVMDLSWEYQWNHPYGNEFELGLST